jgi:hypothetical protein
MQKSKKSRFNKLESQDDSDFDAEKSRRRCCSCSSDTKLTIITCAILWLAVFGPAYPAVLDTIMVVEVKEVGETAEDTLVSSNDLLKEVKASRLTTALALLADQIIGSGHIIGNALSATGNFTHVLVDLEYFFAHTNLTEFSLLINRLEVKVDRFLN